MARNYAALKHDYLLEMEELTDAEFGRLCRELLRYSIDGTESQMKGNERFFWNRVKMQEKRAKESYEELCQTRSESGKKGGRPKKQKEASESKEKRKNQMVSEKSKGNQTQANESKKSQYEKEYEYENNSLPPIGGGLYAHAREGTQYHIPKYLLVQQEDYTRTRAKAPPASQKQWPITASISTPHRLGTHCRRWNALRASWGQR